MLHDNFDDILSRARPLSDTPGQAGRNPEILAIYLNLSHAVNDRYPDFHEKTGTHAGGHARMSMTDMGRAPGGPRRAHRRRAEVTSRSQLDNRHPSLATNTGVNMIKSWSCLCLSWQQLRPLLCIDHKNLDENGRCDSRRYSISAGEIAIEAGRFHTPAPWPNRGLFRLRYSTALSQPTAGHRHCANRLALGTSRPPSPGSAGQCAVQLQPGGHPPSGLRRELGIETPTGIDARGYRIELKGIVTKSIERLSLHLNVDTTS